MVKYARKFNHNGGIAEIHTPCIQSLQFRCATDELDELWRVEYELGLYISRQSAIVG